MSQGTSWTIRDHLNQAAEFGYVRTPGHNAGCQCDQCENVGRVIGERHRSYARRRQEKMIGLYHSRTRGVTIVIEAYGAGYRAILPGGVRSMPLRLGELHRVIEDYEYVKIGG